MSTDADILIVDDHIPDFRWLTRIRGYEAGGVDFISKPFLEPEVLARVKLHLGQCKTKQNLKKLVREHTDEVS